LDQVAVSLEGFAAGYGGQAESALLVRNNVRSLPLGHGSSLRCAQLPNSIRTMPRARLRREADVSDHPIVLMLLRRASERCEAMIALKDREWADRFMSPQDGLPSA